MPCHFDSAEQILTARSKTTEAKGRNIWYLDENNGDSNINELFDFIEKCCSVDIGELRIGLLYHFGTHTTPILVEKKYVSDNSDSMEINLFNTDSRAFDVESGLALRAYLIKTIANLNNNLGKAATETEDTDTETDVKKISLYALGLDPNDTDSRLNTTRQHADGQCVVFSMVDLELMLRAKDLKQYFPRYRCVDDKETLFHIYLLPQQMMFYTQSVHGQLDSFSSIPLRKGLKSHIDENEELIRENTTYLVPISCTLEHTNNQFSDPLAHYKTFINCLSRTMTPVSTIMANHQNSILEMKTDIKSYCEHLIKNNVKNYIIDMFEKEYEQMVLHIELTNKKPKFDASKKRIKNIFDSAGDWCDLLELLEPAAPAENTPTTMIKEALTTLAIANDTRKCIIGVSPGSTPLLFTNEAFAKKNEHEATASASQLSLSYSIASPPLNSISKEARKTPSPELAEILLTPEAAMELSKKIPNYNP